MGFFKNLIHQSITRSKEATLSVLGISDKGLREHLSNCMVDDLGSEGCFLAPPVFEHTFGWESSEKSLGDLPEDLISKQMVETLDSAKSYRFPRSLQPYKHQIAAWKSLAEQKTRSLIVTTGTGSGKTECFMIPIINDLIKEYQSSKTPLVGVRALFLYPLNALINSQQERLDAWTEQYGENIRFCLYNGKTENLESKVRKDQAEKKNQTLSRQRLRREPAPILMTNATMLEYMLVRQIDSPILELSKEAQSLRWIVLDEAHTYIGSQAAEISLLLRRVVQAFGKKAKDIHFIATSATIADKDAETRLKKFLADLAGVDINQVDVITGKRQWPLIKSNLTSSNLTFKEIRNIEKNCEVSLERFKALSVHPLSGKLRQIILEEETPLDLSGIIKRCSNLLNGRSNYERQQEILDWIDLMTGTKPEDQEPPFLKLRIHLFQKMLHGLWSCIDPGCICKTPSLIDWPFGNVYIDQRSRCECGAPVYEIGFCNECSTPYLRAEDVGGKLQQHSMYSEDEFSLSSENESIEIDNNSDPEVLKQLKNNIIIAPISNHQEPFFFQDFNMKTLTLGDVNGHDRINMSYEKDAVCLQCENKTKNGFSFLKYSYLGAPFYIANSVPTILEYCPDPEKKDCDGKSPDELPGRGRKLITFTDSRQGTARMSVRMQQVAERSRLRGLVFEIVRNGQLGKADSAAEENKELEKLKATAEQLKQLGMVSEEETIRQIIKEKEKAKEDRNKPQAVSWDEMISQLSQSFDISRSILDYNKYANPILFAQGNKEVTMAKVLLAREFSRRPKNQNSLETLGIISIGYEGLNEIDKVPEFWESVIKDPRYQVENETNCNLTLQDWKDFLKVSLDFYVRENNFVRIENNIQKWMGSNFYARSFLPPLDGGEDGKSIKKWPAYDEQKKKFPRSRIVKLLLETTILDSGDASDRDKLNTILKTAWNVLTELGILQHFEYGHALVLNKLRFTFPTEGWVCPLTNRILDVAFCGITPYLPNKTGNKNYKCEKVIIPDYTGFTPKEFGQNRIHNIRDLVRSNEVVQKLREQNLWTDISDRTVEGGFYYRTAEHSAQQSSTRLESYESDFRKGKINVLNCSTTMEMGVDIGGISAVVMNNVPPHPANYLQRAGRAGRRNESRAIAYTLCKPDPHNQRAFREPTWPFKTAIPAPSITLDSKPIVQRHVNSLLLSRFLLNQGTTETQNTALNVSYFFGEENSLCNQFIDWLEVSSEVLSEPISILTRDTALSTTAIRKIIKNSIIHIASISDKWQREYENIKIRQDSATEEAYKKALTLELKRHVGEYLLRSLAEKAFLPGYGFPTNVVNFNTQNISDYIFSKSVIFKQSREDSVFNYKELPSRSLNLAIREYAPGAQLVIDGRVYRSAGVSLDWTAPGNAYHFDISWNCTNCGAHGLSEYAYSNSERIICNNCYEPIKQSEKKVVLKPNGFVNDFYEEPGNDLSSQKFINVKKPQIQLNGSEQAFPDERCGYFRFGDEGYVFYQSSGEYDQGYAVCLKCGRAESMSATNELPYIFKNRFHVALGGPDKQGKEKSCPKENVKENVYLGYRIKTDVIEFLLRSPQTGSWLSDTAEEKVIATTLAVAIRNAISERLGIASTEMGYGYRLDKELGTGIHRTVIQIYDEASGGAGFVLAGLSDVSDLLKSAIKQLHCPVDCENVCSHCLAGKDSKIEYTELNRQAALAWIGNSRFAYHLDFPADLFNIPGPHYCSFGPYSYIKAAIEGLNPTKDQNLISFYLNPEIEEWDLLHPQFYNMIMNWLLMDRIKVVLNIPEGIEVPEEIREILYRFIQNGISINSFKDRSSEDKAFIFCQIRSDRKTLSLYSGNSKATIPNANWLIPEEPTTWINTEEIPYIENKNIESSFSTQGNHKTVLIDILNELNGNLQGLTSRFETLIIKQFPSLINSLNANKINKITYSDRFLRSPWTIMLLAELLRVFRKNPIEVIEIATIKPTPSRSITDQIFHNWEKDSDFINVSIKWLKYRLHTSVHIRCVDNTQDLPHGRFMELEWESGKTTRLIFDQGVGPWRSYFSSGYQRFFNFNSSQEDQFNAIEDKFSDVELTRFEKWPTYITIKE